MYEELFINNKYLTLKANELVEILKAADKTYHLDGNVILSDIQYDLLKDMNTISKKYFKLHSSQKMFNKNVHVTEHRETDEKIMIFTK